MFFDSVEIIWVVLAFFFIWVFILSVVFYRLFVHYRRLTKGVTKADLKSVLEELLKDVKGEKKRLDELKKGLKGVEKESLFYLQKVGLVRFNPFAETGGNQSFCLALLDANDSGLVVSSLHSREATRIYAKPVRKGKEVGYTFSEEEKKAISRAKKIK